MNERDFADLDLISSEDEDITTDLRVEEEEEAVQVNRKVYAPKAVKKKLSQKNKKNQDSVEFQIVHPSMPKKDLQTNVEKPQKKRKPKEAGGSIEASPKSNLKPKKSRKAVDLPPPPAAAPSSSGPSKARKRKALKEAEDLVLKEELTNLFKGVTKLLYKYT